MKNYNIPITGGGGGGGTLVPPFAALAWLSPIVELTCCGGVPTVNISAVHFLREDYNCSDEDTVVQICWTAFSARLCQINIQPIFGHLSSYNRYARCFNLLQ